MTPWLLGFPLLVFAFAFCFLIWENHKARMQEFMDQAADHIRETLEGIGRMP